MAEYEFTLVLDRVGRDIEQVEIDLYGGGCDDALLTFSNASVEVDFTREAESPTKAVVSAIKDVSKAGYRIRRAGPDLVSTADILDLLGRTRSSIQQWVSGKRGDGDFPEPVMRAGDRPIFRLRDVCEWEARRNPNELTTNRLKLARGIATTNTAILYHEDRNEKLSLKDLITSVKRAEKVKVV